MTVALLDLVEKRLRQLNKHWGIRWEVNSVWTASGESFIQLNHSPHLILP
jgi:hypothetical protein